MKSILKPLSITALIFLSGFSLPSYAQGAPDRNLTTTPVIQTAKYAQKWWMPRHQAILDRNKQGNVDLLLVGDSITHRWEERAKENYNATFGHRNAVNMGFGGDRTEHLLWRLHNGELDGISPKVAVLMIGTNNIGQDKVRIDTPEETLKGIRAVLSELTTRLPKTKVLLLALFPRGATTDDTKRQAVDKINQTLPTFADNKQVYFLNINQAFLDNKGNLSKDIMPDYLHPFEKGYAIWGREMEPTLAKLLDE